MSKELVISAASHERRVAILEEGQLVEIYIEREKEFALVGSIYKGRVTRVLPGMQSAFVDIGLDGDAVLYVSDVFENLEDYDHGHGHEPTPAVTHGEPPTSSEHIELPGEMLAHAHEAPAAESVSEESHGESQPHDVHTHVEESEPGAPGVDGAQHTSEEERQPDSNESAPQNFAPRYNPTQYRPSPSFSPRAAGDRGGSDRGGDRQNFGRSGGRGRFGRGGGSRGRGGRSSGGGCRPSGGRDLPPSKYASPQGGESRGGDRGSDRGGDRGGRGGYSQRGGYDNRGPRRDFDNRGDAPRTSAPSAPIDSTEEPFVLPGESLAKYRGRPAPELTA